jgi:hypothetical protein
LLAIIKAARHSTLPSSNKKAATTSLKRTKNSMLFIRITGKRRVEGQDNTTVYNILTVECITYGPQDVKGAILLSHKNDATAKKTDPQ